MLLKAPFFVVGAPVQGDYFIDRTDLLEHLTRLVAFDNGNILLFGKRRVGKTSLCLQFIRGSERLSDVLVGYMSMEANYDQNQQEFIQAVLLHVISGIASKIFSKKYSELLFDLVRPRLFDGDYMRLLRIFELVRCSDRSVARSTTKEVGASLIGEAKIGEGDQVNAVVGHLNSFEALAILGELVDFLRGRGVRKFVLIIDEANKLTLEANSRLIRDNLSLFSSRGLQFCFVTTPEVIACVSEADELFHDKVEVGAFESVDVVKNLIHKYSVLAPADSSLPFSDAAIDTIWRVSRGAPYTVQLLCSRSFLKASESGGDMVEVGHVLEVVSEQALGV